MNCQLCQKELDAYREGRLSDDMRTQVEAHLKVCNECAESYRIQITCRQCHKPGKRVIVQSLPYTRIMARIENPEETGYRTIPPFRRILKPAFIMTSMAAAIFAGVLIGNIYKPVRHGICNTC